MSEPGVSVMLPLLAPAHLQRPIAWRAGRPVQLAEFLRDVDATGAALSATRAAALPRGALDGAPGRPPDDAPWNANAAAMIDLCEDRYRFIVAYAAALRAGHRVLLSPSAAGQVVAEVARAHAGSYCCDDAFVERALQAADGLAPAQAAAIAIPAERIAMVGLTSGSTGEPKSYPKRWDSLHGSTARNAQAIRAALAQASSPASSGWILATVPPQHMYGMELSVLLPLIGGLPVHSGRPLFPADIARALQALPQPRILVSTPIHLRSLVESGLSFPPTSLIVSATAPLDRALACAVERRFGGRLLELFGSTETCVFATRYTAREEQWQPYAGVRLQPREDGTLVDAPWFAEPVLLQDLIELRACGGFVVRGRSADLIEVAGKRASLGDLTRRVLAIEGVRDAVVFQPDREAVATVRRLAALVVAPGLEPRAILQQLAASVDPAFLPRPLLIVDALPRNELGKLPRERLMQLLRRRRD